MQNQQMAAMVGMNAAGGPVGGTPLMTNPNEDPRANLNTYIYDYFLRNNHARLARLMIECDLQMNLLPPTKPSPSGRNMNGVDPMDADSKDDLPHPKVPGDQSADNSFLLDWWQQFWDIFKAARMKQGGKGLPNQYIAHARNLTQLQSGERERRLAMQNAMGQQYQNMMARLPNGATGNDLKRAVAMNNRNPSNPNQMGNMNQMKNQAMMSAQMQRDGSGMDMNGQRPQSPGSNENAPSPAKRPRVEGNNFNGQPIGAARSQGGMNPANMSGNQFSEFAQQAQNVQQKSIEVYAQSLAHQQRSALNNHAMAQGMNTGVQGSPMNQQGLDGQHDVFAGNARPGIVPGPGQQPQGNHALQDYQMQLMLLEQQNKKRLLMARQEQDNMSTGPHGQPAVAAPGFPPSMSPQGSRAGPSPQPSDQIKGRTPKLNQQGLPGSPMPDPSMQQNRSSPAPNMNFDQMPPGMPPQFYPMGGPQTPMMRPPSSHPGTFNGQQFTPQQMETMQRANPPMPNGTWRPNGMMPTQGQGQPGPMNTPQQRSQIMPPPPAPAGEQPRAQEPSPSQPAQAPPTPSQSSKPNPKKKATKDNAKKPAKSKAATAGATPASNEEPPPTPTPSTPITPMHPSSFNKGQNGQGQPQQQPPQAPAAASAPQQQPPMDNNAGAPFGNINDDANFDLGFGPLDGPDALENFDFDSFLHVGNDDGAFGSLGGDFGFGDGVEAGAGDM